MIYSVLRTSPPTPPHLILYIFFLDTLPICNLATQTTKFIIVFCISYLYNR